MTVPNTPEFARVRTLPIPPYNPLNQLDASLRLATECGTCGAGVDRACGPECHRPSPLGPAAIRIMPGDAFDTNPDVVEPARPDRRRYSL